MEAPGIYSQKPFLYSPGIPLSRSFPQMTGSGDSPESQIWTSNPASLCSPFAVILFFFPVRLVGLQLSSGRDVTLTQDLFCSFTFQGTLCSFSAYVALPSPTGPLLSFIPKEGAVPFPSATFTPAVTSSFSFPATHSRFLPLAFFAV